MTARYPGPRPFPGDIRALSNAKARPRSDNRGLLRGPQAILGWLKSAPPNADKTSGTRAPVLIRTHRLFGLGTRGRETQGLVTRLVFEDGSDHGWTGASPGWRRLPVARIESMRELHRATHAPVTLEVGVFRMDAAKTRRYAPRNRYL